MDNINILEAVLFASGEPVSKKRLAEVLSVTQGAVEDYAIALNKRYKKTSLQIADLEDSLQIATKSGYGDYIRAILETGKQTRLTDSALEVLAIAAYHGPVTKTYIENIRGVDSSSIVNGLVSKGLLEDAGRLEIAGRPITYKVTPQFLLCFPDFNVKQLKLDSLENLNSEEITDLE